MHRPIPPRPLADRHDPLAGMARLILDGTNLLHALRRSPEPPPAATLIGRLRAIIPAPIQIVLVFDGAEGGVGRTRVASGLTVRYSGRQPADRLIERLVADDPAFTLVVTDDRELARSVRDAGAHSIPNQWLVRRLGRPHLSSPAPGRPSPPSAPTSGARRGPGGADDAVTGSDGHRLPPAEAERDAAAVSDGRRWRPGRRSTRKRGNPKRGHSDG